MKKLPSLSGAQSVIEVPREVASLTHPHQCRRWTLDAIYPRGNRETLRVSQNQRNGNETSVARIIERMKSCLVLMRSAQEDEVDARGSDCTIRGSPAMVR